MHSEGLRLRKIVTDRWVHVFPGLVSCGIGRVKESMGQLELQCFLGGIAVGRFTCGKKR